MAKKSPAKVGRPTKYKPEYCEKLVEHMQQGFSFESFASVAKTCKDTVYHWVNQHPEFSEAKKRGTAHLEIFYTRMGMNLAQGEYKNGSATAWIYLTKNILKWTDRSDLKITGDFQEKKDEHEILRAVDRRKLIALAKQEEKAG